MLMSYLLALLLSLLAPLASGSAQNGPIVTPPVVVTPADTGGPPGK